MTKIAAYDSSFAKKEKKKILTQEINEQKAIINRTPTEGQFKLKGLFWFGLFWLSMLFFIPVLAGASVEFFMREMSFLAWAVIIIPALLCMVFGIIKGVPKQEDIEKNRAIVAEAQKKLKEKEDALQKLG